MEDKDYVSYEVAKLLKSKGFNLSCDSFFTDDGDTYTCWGCVHKPKKEVAEKEYLQPTLYEAQKWLREKHNISVASLSYGKRDANGCSWGYIISSVGNDWIYTTSKDGAIQRLNFATYEEALNEGIKQALIYI